MMADDEKKDRGGEGDGHDIKPAPSMTRKRASLKTGLTSKSSLKSARSSNSENSSSSLALKRQSEFERIARGPRYLPTYRLDPKKPFKYFEVYKILENIVEREVASFPQYDGLMGPKIVQTIAAEVRNSVKSLNYDRYKICVLVYLGEKKLQGFQAAFRALWDHERDGWATYFFQCRTYFISCTCFGLYHD